MPYSVLGECRNSGRTHFKKGQIPWNKEKKGIYSLLTLSKMSLAGKNRMSNFKGKHHTLENRILLSKKLSRILQGNKRNAGKPWTEVRRMAEAFKIKKPRSIPIIRNGREYSPLWNEIRKSIYQRDHWICQECGRHCGSKTGISCHHIDYDISNNDLSNLITLCVSCHAKTNFKRIDWMTHYKNKEMKATLHF
jgi:5-methylcytosine-specific restriction endonuclease McrA